MFYIAGKADTIKIAKNILIKKDSSFNYRHFGLILPKCFGKIGIKYFNIQHNFNKFIFYTPFLREKNVAVFSGYFDYLASMKEYNRRYLPYFQPMSSSLNI